MQVKLAYGREGLSLNVPDKLDVIEPRFVPGLEDESQAILEGLRNPIGSKALRGLLHSDDSVVIVHTDITRATPNDRILPVLLAEIESAGITKENITLINGLGTHRPQTEDELRQMLGNQIVDDYRCLQHNCRDNANLVALGKTSLGHPVRINKTYLEADIKLLTGFIEPHFFAGFSGGPKAILPSLAGEESVFTNHAYHMLGHPKATWGITEGNPIWEEMREVALLTEPDFLLNVALNNRHEVTSVFAGDVIKAHQWGCAFVKEVSMSPVKQPYDFAITTNGGYPLDQNLYQSIKGLSAAARIVRPGGAILIVVACEDGLPNHGLYAQLLKEGGNPQKLLKMIADPGFQAQDQWQAQIQAQIQQQAEVYVYSDGLSDQQILSALFHPCGNIAYFINEISTQKGPYGCIIPDGPQVIPYLKPS